MTAPLPCTCTHDGRRQDADGLCFTCGGEVPVEGRAVSLATPGFGPSAFRRRFVNRDPGAELWLAIAPPTGDQS